MRDKLMALFEAFMYYVIYLFSGIIGNVAAVAVSSVIIGFEYIYSHMQAGNTEYFNEVMIFVKSEPALSILLANISVLLIYWMACRSKQIKLSKYVGIHRLNFISALASVAAGFVAHGLITVALENLKPITQAIVEYERQMEWMREGNVLLLLIVTMIGAPVVEEVVFRGVLLSSLGRVITPLGGLLVTSILFGVAHGNVVQGMYSFVLGIVLGFIRIRSKNLWNSILMHITFNSSNIISAAFGISVAWMSPWMIVLILVLLVWISSKPKRAFE